ncbi:MAG: type 2 isopentenyl-diphosphate Delta-isomerase [Thermoplasmata archaeon]
MGAGHAPNPTRANAAKAPPPLDLSHRKADHVKVVLGEKVEGRYRYWNDIQLVHDALPEFDFEEIDTSVTFLGKSLAAPLVITGMTGGFPDAARINDNLAAAAAALRIGMGVGSERAAILQGQFPESYSCVARHAIPLKFANIGAPQIIPQGTGQRVVGPDEARQAMALIGADTLAIHLNFLQEMVQPEGDRRARGCLDRIGELARELPVLVKETGAGLSGAVGRRLVDRGIRALDVSGTGGTSFAAVEHYRARERGAEREARLGQVFWDWGIPTPVAVVETAPLGVPVIASGGVRSGLDVARSLALGAWGAGIAGGVLRAATLGPEEARRELEQVLYELRVAMFLTGARTVEEMRRRPHRILGETAAWLSAR